MTGLYSHQAGIGAMTVERRGPQGELPGYIGHLNDDCVTLAEVLHSAGYGTSMTGKWHMGVTSNSAPWVRGFDRSLCGGVGGGFYFEGDARAVLILDGKEIGRGGTNGIPAHWYSTDLWADQGIRFTDETRAQKKPFFLYLAFNAPHFPLQAPDADIAQFRGKYKAGWDKLRVERYQRQVAMGLIDSSWPLSPRPAEVPAWDNLTAAEQDRYDYMMAIYAAAVSHLDQAVGRVVAHLRETGELENTLILFHSDNGGNAESGVPGRFAGEHPGGVGSGVWVGECWAQLQHTPFRRFKHFDHEGGISTPLIVHWPAGIPAARAGTWERQPAHLLDLMATFVDITGATYPARVNGHDIHPAEGISLRPAFAGQPLGRTAPIFWEHEGNAAVRRGPWKLVRMDAVGAWELYNMDTDRTEQQDVARERPELVRELAGLWDAWATRANVNPVAEYRHEPHGQPMLLNEEKPAPGRKKAKKAR